MSLYATKDLLYYTHTTYTRCLSSDDGAKEVVTAVLDPDNEVAQADMVNMVKDTMTIPQFVEYIKTAIAEELA